MFKKILTLALCIGLLSTKSFAYIYPSPMIQDDVLDEIMNAIPSPAEITELIKSLNTDYPKRDLRSSEKIQTYSGDPDKQALNLGVYSTDLAFASMFKKNLDALKFLKAVEKLAGDLSMSQFFTSKDTKEAQTAIDNGTLTDYATKKIDQINNYLVSKSRQHISMLMLTGGWVEAVYICCRVYEKSKSSKLKEKIGEQKIVLQTLLEIYDIYGKGGLHSDIKKQLQDLKTSLDKVKIKTVIGEDKVTMTPDGPVVESGNKQLILINDALVSEIEAKIAKIRANII